MTPPYSVEDVDVMREYLLHTALLPQTHLVFHVQKGVAVELLHLRLQNSEWAQPFLSMHIFYEKSEQAGADRVCPQ